jgi:MerR family transcriptional regulator/heat shock protein HspR
MILKQSNQKPATYMISVVAAISGLHPQTLRIYERRGLINPTRTSGGNRRYSQVDIEVLRRIQELRQSGLNISGIKKVIQLESEVKKLKNKLALVKLQMRDRHLP